MPNDGTIPSVLHYLSASLSVSRAQLYNSIDCVQRCRPQGLDCLFVSCHGQIVFLGINMQRPTGGRLEPLLWHNCDWRCLPKTNLRTENLWQTKVMLVCIHATTWRLWPNAPVFPVSWCLSFGIWNMRTGMKKQNRCLQKESFGKKMWPKYPFSKTLTLRPSVVLSPSWENHQHPATGQHLPGRFAAG